MKGKTMAGQDKLTTQTLKTQLTERYGVLLSQAQLTELLGRSTGGLRYSLCAPADDRTRSLKACGRRIGRRVYYPAVEVAHIIATPDAP